MIKNGIKYEGKKSAQTLAMCRNFVIVIQIIAEISTLKMAGETCPIHSPALQFSQLNLIECG